MESQVPGIITRAALYAARLIAYAPAWEQGVVRYQGARVITAFTPRRGLRKVVVYLSGVQAPVIAYAWQDRIAVEYGKVRGAVLPAAKGGFRLVWFDGRKA